jgi:hypothetical protein
MFRNSVRTSQETHYVSATKPNLLMLFREIIAVCCENHTQHINTLCGQNAGFLNIKASGTYSNLLALECEQWNEVFRTYIRTEPHMCRWNMNASAKRITYRPFWSCSIRDVISFLLFHISVSSSLLAHFILHKVCHDLCYEMASFITSMRWDILHDFYPYPLHYFSFSSSIFRNNFFLSLWRRV